MSSPRYPVPAKPPTYRRAPGKVSARGSFSFFQLVAAVFVVVALLMAFWLAALLLVSGFSGNRLQFLNLVFFWVVTAYLALPRVHQLFTVLYLPDYFIGRTRTGDGVLGDPINVALDGSEADLHAAMEAAGWTKADELSLRSAWGMIHSSLLRRSYPAAPVSGLYLFGRRHDFAYQQEVDGNPSRRHHVRFWRVPPDWLLPGGHPTDWLASATYDRAVGFSIFTGQITHKIDEDIDIERDYLVDTLRYADPASQVHVIRGFSTAYHHRNGGGDRVHTDGDLPVVDLGGACERLDGERIVAVLAPGHRSLTQHAVPPPTLLATGVLVAARALLALVALASDQLRIWFGGLLGVDQYNPTLAGVLSLASVALWWAVVARKRIAWVALMLVAVLDGLIQLVDIQPGEVTGLGSLAGAALVVMIVLCVSATEVRTWVSRGRVDPQLHLPESAHLRSRLSRH